MKNCTIIGLNAGIDLPVDSENVVIIGDNIKSLNKNQPNVLFLGELVAIGETIFGININLKEVVTSIVHPTIPKTGAISDLSGVRGYGFFGGSYKSLTDSDTHDGVKC